MVHTFYRHYNDYLDGVFPYRGLPLYPDIRLSPVPTPLVVPIATPIIYPQDFEIASYCSWPNSVQLVQKNSIPEYKQIKLTNKEESCTNICNTTFNNVVDSKKIINGNTSDCICKINSNDTKLEYVCI